MRGGRIHRPPRAAGAGSGRLSRVPSGPAMIPHGHVVGGLRMGMDHDARVAIIGLGYVGLPLAIAFEEAGLQVVGIDASETRIAELRGGTSPIDDISDERLASALANGLRISS